MMICSRSPKETTICLWYLVKQTHYYILLKKKKAISLIRTNPSLVLDIFLLKNAYYYMDFYTFYSIQSCLDVPSVNAIPQTPGLSEFIGLGYGLNIRDSRKFICWSLSPTSDLYLEVESLGGYQVSKRSWRWGSPWCDHHPYEERNRDRASMFSVIWRHKRALTRVRFYRKHNIQPSKLQNHEK